MRFVTNFIIIAVLALFAYMIISLLIRDARNKKAKESILKDSIQTQAVITDAQSRSGGNSGFINITLYIDYTTQEGKKYSGKKDAVIDALNTHKYQPGETISIHYSRQEPEQFLIDIPNPLKKRK
ncbi:DUF3592 domain-containing protein [Franconibacter helveticus]|uniref:DUF3592 domain-containing protein n=1 Tax=Franconibacter helveticus TaxID=357240 RepID=UPI00066D3975|nr:DUF3592 domain-containing protein [Franconibacter helveticus]